jgi:glutamate racemase
MFLNVKKMMDRGVKAIVIACNTATAAAAKDLREKFLLPIIGIEPAIKTSAQYRENSNVLVMATPLTLKQEKIANQTDEENAIMQKLFGSLPREEYLQRDMPEGTVITVPYYTDLNVLVTLK